MVIVHVNSDSNDNIIIKNGTSWELIQSGYLIIRNIDNKMVALFSSWIGVEKK